MSLEAQLQELTAAIKGLTEAVKGGEQITAAEPSKGRGRPKKESPEAAPAASVTVTQNPAAVSAPTPPAFIPPAPPAPPAPPTMPPIPSFVAPPAAAPGVPFTDGPTLLKWVMEQYKALGPVKGAQIQKVINDLGHTNVNDIKPAQYADFHARVVSLAA